MDRTHKDMNDTTEDVDELEQDAYLEFCWDNHLHPDDKRAQRLWDERMTIIYDSGY